MRLSPSDIEEGCNHAIAEATERVADELAKAGNKIEPVSKLLKVSVSYVRNVRDHKQLGSFRQSVIPIALRIISTPKE
jgi:hypothetical protein